MTRSSGRSGPPQRSGWSAGRRSVAVAGFAPHRMRRARLGQSRKPVRKAAGFPVARWPKGAVAQRPGAPALPSLFGGYGKERATRASPNGRGALVNVSTTAIIHARL